MARALRLLPLTAPLWVTVACVVSPQPSPPATPDLEGDKLGLILTELVASSMVGFRGEPGAVHPPEGQVLITNLDDTLQPSVASVRADGSFDLAVPGLPGQRFRFQAKLGTQRSEPVDLTVDPVTGRVVRGPSPTACLGLTPPRWAHFEAPGTARALVIENRCGAPVTFEAPRLRRGRAGFSVSPTAGGSLPTGVVTTLTLTLEGGAEPEDVLLFTTTAPNAETYAITLTDDRR